MLVIGSELQRPLPLACHLSCLSLSVLSTADSLTLSDVNS